MFCIVSKKEQGAADHNGFPPLYCLGHQFQHGMKPYLRWRARQLIKVGICIAPCRALAGAAALAPYRLPG